MATARGKGVIVAEKTVLCLHHEALVGHTGTCSICGQVREYDPHEKLPPKIIKRGRIDGVLTDVIPVMNQESIEVPSPSGEQAIQTLKPPGWDKMGKREKAKWFKEHREAILKDVRELGELKARERWEVGSSTWLGLKRRWGFGVIRKGAYGDLNGRHKEIPRRPKKRGLHEEYFEQNKEAILADYQSLRITDFLKKWGISSTTWLKLKIKWEATPKIHQDSKARPKQEFTLPEFPAFNDKWGDSVQVKWLEVYPELFREEKTRGVK